MKITLSFLGIAMLVGACGGPVAETSPPSTDSVVAPTDADRQAHRATMKPDCKSGRPIGAHCGLITKRVEMDDFRAAFKAKKCADKSDDDCQDLFESSIDDWLQQRYKYANFDQVDKTCAADAQKCSDPKARELLLQQSHNAVIEDVAHATDRIDRDNEEAREEAIERQEAMADNFLYGPATIVIVVHQRRAVVYPAIRGGLHEHHR